MAEQNLQSLFRLRVRYGKTGRLAYLGHLEVLHTIERIVRRAGLPYAVTQGFSPHMRVGFTSALPVGTSSVCEWFDLFMTEYVPAEEAFSHLLAASPDDLKPDFCSYIDVRSPALTALITRNEFVVTLRPRSGFALDASSLASSIDRLLEAGPITYKRGKKDKVLDLPALLVGFETFDGPCGSIELRLDTRVSNEGALRPEILLAGVDRIVVGGEYTERPIVSTGIQDLVSIESYAVCRISQHAEDENGTLVPVLKVFEMPSRPVTAASVPYL